MLGVPSEHIDKVILENLEVRYTCLRMEERMYKHAVFSYFTKQ